MDPGYSISEFIKLVQFSARIYVAFNVDANDSSQAQVEGLVREFAAFHHCLEELAELMKDYGKPLPFSYGDFKETLKRCEETIEPYKANLIDRKMSIKKFLYTIKYIGKEKEIDNLRHQINGHFQSIQLCIQFLHLRMQVEATKQTNRLLDMVPFRSVSIGGQSYTSNAISTSSRADPLALPAPSEADQLYRDYLIFNRWLKSQDEQLALQGNTQPRPLSLGDTPTATPSRDDQTHAVFYHLRRELEDANAIAENRAKRVAVGGRTHLSPSEAWRQEVRNLPPAPVRTYTLDTENSGSFSRFENNDTSMADSTTTIRPTPASSSQATSPAVSPQIPTASFEPVDWGHIAPSASPLSPNPQDIPGRTPSESTWYSDLSTSPKSQSPGGLGISTAETTPEGAARPLHHKLSAASLVTIALGPGALQWNKLCHKVWVEKSTLRGGPEEKECDVQWRFREDAGIEIRSVYRSTATRGVVKPWITQQFPASGPSIPLTTTHRDGDISIDFPRKSFGKLDKGCLDIKYIITGTESSARFQTLLYTNNGKEAAELLFDRPIVTISSDLHRPECRGKNLRLWKRNEMHIGANGMETVDVLVILFYTSALPEEKAHWVEEPHYIFQWLDASVFKKSTEKLVLTVSKDPSKWSKDKVRRKSSKASDDSVNQEEGGGRRSGILRRTSTASSAKSVFGASKPSGAGNLNRFEYSELDIRFQTEMDRMDFLEIWQKYVKPL
ncbi:hypothetical protein DM02DRAFT_690958 [Periconia macrospinosa]|uniref:Uncharacterized protein n=1 Tax=Periconia macrospinosa TaxID=97972 RepID=A0A2V1DB93_9PLEO|nr:hypothetical protein DM02DRAFT_690958 [Periconia macrospinosa]